MDSIFIGRLTWLIERVLIVLSVSIAAVVLLQVVFRYLVQQPLFWSEELPRYLLVWMTFLAAALAQKHDAHMNITLVVNWLPPRARRAVRILGHLVILGFLGVLVYSGGLVTGITAQHRSTALQIPMAAVYVALPIGAALMSVYLVLQIVRELRQPRG